MAEMNLRQLYGTTFGFVALPFRKETGSVEVTKAEPFQGQAVGGQEPERYGLMGTPIHLPCKLENYDLPNEPLIDITGERIIVKTQVDGNDGTFKELYSTGDMAITIRGICVNEDDPDSYPEDQVRAIRNIIETRRHVKIVNRLTSLFNIEHVAIESFSFPSMEGELGMQAYELRCVSDREFALNLREQ
jgi:hypothetical protein